MRRILLEVLRAAGAVEGKADGRVYQLKSEALVAERRLRLCLGELWKLGLIERSLVEFHLTDKGKEVLRKHEGKVPFSCSVCGAECLVSEEDARSFLEARCPKCGGEFIKEKLYLPVPGLVYPAPEGSPPTCQTLRGFVSFTFKPYVDKEGIRRCGARKADGTPCPFPAIADSLSGRCRKHGGRAGKGLEKSITGTYSRYLAGSSREIYERMIRDPDYLDLANEIALLRGKVAEKYDELSPTSLAKSLDIIGRLVDRVKLKEAHLWVHVEQLDLIVGQVAQVVVRNLERCPHCGGSLAEIAKRVSVDFREMKFLPKPTVGKENKDERF